MKVFALAFAALILGVSAAPAQDILEEFKNILLQEESHNDISQQNLVSTVIIRAIRDIARRIRDIGLDPLEIDSFEIERSSALTDFELLIEDLSLTGVSDVIINDIKYSYFTRRLSFDLVLPEIALKIGRSFVGVRRLAREVTSNVSGSLKIINVGIKGEIRFRMDPVNGVSVRSVELQNTLGDIESNLSVDISDNDVSDTVNLILGEVVPYLFDKYNSEINRLLEYLVKQLLNNE